MVSRSRLIAFLLLTFLWIMPLRGMSEAMADVFTGDPFSLIQPPVPTHTSKPEIVEVFNFKCPHCYEFHPFYTKWSHDNRNRYSIRSLPIFWGNQTDAPVKAYFAAHFLGKGEAMKGALFKAHFDEGMDIESLDDLFLIAEEVGLLSDCFQKAFTSFGVAATLSRTQSEKRAFGVRSTPSLVINGRYKITPTDSGGDFKRMLEIADGLMTK